MMMSGSRTLGGGCGGEGGLLAADGLTAGRSCVRRNAGMEEEGRLLGSVSCGSF